MPESVDGKPIRDPDELRRIKALAIPPACTDVWICPIPSGHLQATGRDAKGRKQYRYHPRWRDDKALRLGAALAYYTVFSLAPLLVILIAIAGLFFGQEAAQGRKCKPWSAKRAPRPSRR